jgi:hypothetical protein
MVPFFGEAITVDSTNFGMTANLDSDHLSDRKSAGLIRIRTPQGLAKQREPTRIPGRFA